MRVLLEATAEARPGFDRGIGRYVREIVLALTAHDHTVLTTASRMNDGRLAEFTAVPGRYVRLASRRDYDVFHAPTPYYMALPPHRPVIASVLDLIPLDLTQHIKTGFKARFFHQLAARATRILTISEYSAMRIVERLDVPADRVFVAPLPARPVFRPDGEVRPSSRPYVAAMVDLRTPDPRKRADWLKPLAARLDRYGADLVVVGNQTELIEWPGAVGAGRVSDGEWAAILRGASFFAYTSSYEGQGLPPLEAMACGTPVLAMNNTSIAEVVSSAGQLVDEQPTSGDGCEAFAEAALNLISSSCLPDMGRASLRRAAEFSVERFSDRVNAAHVSAVEA